MENRRGQIPQLVEFHKKPTNSNSEIPLRFSFKWAKPVAHMNRTLMERSIFSIHGISRCFWDVFWIVFQFYRFEDDYREFGKEGPPLPSRVYEAHFYQITSFGGAQIIPTNEKASNHTYFTTFKGLSWRDLQSKGETSKHLFGGFAICCYYCIVGSFW